MHVREQVPFLPIFTIDLEVAQPSHQSLSWLASIPMEYNMHQMMKLYYTDFYMLSKVKLLDIQLILVHVIELPMFFPISPSSDFYISQHFTSDGE